MTIRIYIDTLTIDTLHPDLTVTTFYYGAIVHDQTAEWTIAIHLVPQCDGLLAWSMTIAQNGGALETRFGKVEHGFALAEEMNLALEDLTPVIGLTIEVPDAGW